jgi:hypothetical protein
VPSRLRFNESRKEYRMAAEVDRNAPSFQTVSREEMVAALEKVLGSKYFAHAPMKQKFLRVISEFYLNGRAPELNEYLIGREVYSRDDSYDPATDPIVRVGAHSVREKLELYYHKEGANDKIRIEIPIGCYEPIFAFHDPRLLTSKHAGRLAERADLEERSLTSLTEVPVYSSTSTAVWKRPVPLLGGGVAVLLTAVLVLLYVNYDLRRERAIPRPTDHASSGTVWQPFLQSEQPTLVVLSNPVVYRLLNAGDREAVSKNSVELPPEQAAQLTQALKDTFAVRNSPPNPRLVLSLDTYTGMGEAIGVQRVTELLRAAGKNILLKRSRTVSAEDLKNHHVILLGSVWANEWSGKLAVQDEFSYTSQATIENHHPRQGEEKVYRSKYDERTGLLLEDYALVTVKPNISEGNVVMVLAGLRSAGTEAAAEYVTSKTFLNELNERLSQMADSSGPPKYYQALLKVGVENAIPTTISLLTIHELSGQKR